jgi:hypothetical protein
MSGLESLRLAEQKTAAIALAIREHMLRTLAGAGLPDKELAVIEANMAHAPDEEIIVNFVRCVDCGVIHLTPTQIVKAIEQAEDLDQFEELTETMSEGAAEGVWA